MQTRIYDFHGIVRLKIVSSQKQYISFFDNEYRYIKKIDNKDDAPVNILIYIGFPLPRVSDGKPGEYYSVKFKNLCKVKYRIDGIDKIQTTIYFCGDWTIHFYSFIMCSFLLNEIIDPLLYLKFIQKNCIILHSACLSDGEKGFLFAADSGGGKTTLALKLAKNGMIFLNDDKTIVSKEGVLYAYPRSLRLYTYNIKIPPCNSLSWKIKIICHIKDILRSIFSKVLKTDIYLATRVHINEIIPDVKTGRSYKLGKFLLLTNGTEEQIKRFDYLNSTDKDLMAKYDEKISILCELNGKLRNNILKKHKDLMRVIESKEREILTNITEKMGSIYSINPRLIKEDNNLSLRQALKI